MAKARPEKKPPRNGDMPAPNPYGLGARLAATVVPLIVLVLGRYVSLPNVDFAAVPPGSAALDHANVLALGVMPLMSAAFLVEIAAVVVPRWRHLRHGGDIGRAKLQWATNIVFLILAFFQGYATATLLQTQMLLPNVGIGAAMTTALTLVAGAAVLKLAADFASARGLVNGYGVVVAAWCLIDIGHVVWFRRQLFTPMVWLVLIGEIVFIGLITYFVLERLRSGAGAQSTSRAVASARIDTENPYAAPNEMSRSTNESATRDEPTVQLPNPASGVGPYSMTWSFLAFPASAAMLPGMQKVADLLEEPVPRGLASISLLFSFTVLLTFLYQQPRCVAAVYERAAETQNSRGQTHADAREALRNASAIALLFMLGLLVIDLFALKYAPMVKLSVASTALTAAVLIDFANEWRMTATRRDLVPVWPEHRPYAIAAAREALRKAGIVVHFRDERQRRLLQFGAAYVPIEICVPVADAEKARQILEKLLLAKPVSDAQPSVDAGPLAIVTAERRRTSWNLVAGIVVLTLAAFALSMPEMRPAQVDRPRTTKLEFVLTDDEHSVVDEAVDLSLEERLHVRIESEQVALGPEKNAVRKYAVVEMADGETVEAARLRLEQWLAATKLPAGTRASVGEYQRYDTARSQFYVAGWRTYLLKGTAILTEKDVYEAKAMPDTTNPGHWLVRLVFTSEAAVRFEQVTGENIKRRFAILLDGRVTSAPVIQSKIPGGIATITMGTRDPEREHADAVNLEKALNGD